MATFVRVVDAGSLSHAARTLRVSVAAVSRQMTALEEELGAPLLSRTTRKVAMTDEGKRLYPQAVRTLREAEEARAIVRSDGAIDGQLTVSAPTALGVSLLDIAAAKLVRRHPALRIDLRLEDQPIDLLSEGVDVAIRAGLPPPDTTTVVARPLAEGPRVVVASTSYLRRFGEPREPTELASHAVIVHLHAGAGVGKWTLRHEDGRSVSLPIDGQLRVNALHAVRNAALAGAGMAMLPLFMVKNDLATRKLHVVSLSGFAPTGQVIHGLVRTEARRLARVEAFLSHARAALRASLG